VFINVEISFDLESAAFVPMLNNWGRIHKLGGAPPETLQNLPSMMKETLCILPPAKVEDQMQAAGIGLPVFFLQSLMIGAGLPTRRAKRLGIDFVRINTLWGQVVLVPSIAINYKSLFLLYP